MPEPSFAEITEIYTEALKQSTSGKGFAFDNQVKDLDELWEKHGKRKDVIDKLKGKIGSKLHTKDWCPIMAQVDYLSRAERDTRMRFKSRVACFKKRGNSHHLGLASIEVANKIISHNEA